MDREAAGQWLAADGGSVRAGGGVASTPKIAALVAGDMQGHVQSAQYFSSSGLPPTICRGCSHSHSLHGFASFTSGSTVEGYTLTVFVL